MREVRNDAHKSAWRMAFSCREAARLSSEAMERDLSLPEKIAWRFHLALCGLCKRYNRQLKLLHDGLHEHSEGLTEATDVKLTKDAKARIKNALGNTTG